MFQVETIVTKTKYLSQMGNEVKLKVALLQKYRWRCVMIAVKNMQSYIVFSFLFILDFLQGMCPAMNIEPFEWIV